MRTVVHGPMGCGKTHHAELIRRHFKCDTVVDSAEDIVAGTRRAPPGNVLFLTYWGDRQALRKAFPDAQIVAFGSLSFRRADGSAA